MEWESLSWASGAGHGQLPLMPVLETLGGSYKVTCGWLLLVLGLEALGTGCAVN